LAYRRCKRAHARPEGAPCNEALSAGSMLTADLLSRQCRRIGARKGLVRRPGEKRAGRDEFRREAARHERLPACAAETQAPSAPALKSYVVLPKPVPVWAGSRRISRESSTAACRCLTASR